MPWYKLPHADMVMWFDQEMGLEPATVYAAGGVVEGPVPQLGDISEVVIPNEPEAGAEGSTLADPGPETIAPEPEAEAT